MKTLELKVPPPLVAALAAFQMWGLSQVFLSPSFDLQYKLETAIFIAALGLLVDFFALFSFIAAKTTVNPLKPEHTSALVKTGVYQYTRNPMYVGNFIFLTAYLVWLGSPVNALCLVLYVLYMNVCQIQPEERVLQSMFGDEYVEYCQNVRRWV